MASNIAYAYKTIVKGWQSDNYTIYESVVGRVHLTAQEVKKWESDIPDHKGFYKTNAKKTKESMMKLLTDDKPILSLIISPPDLRTLDEEEL